MEIISRTKLASQAAEKWKRRYCDEQSPLRQWPTTVACNSHEIYQGLLALGANPSPVDVDAVIGEGSWTEVRCDECGRRVDRVAVLGYAHCPSRICYGCIKVAAKLLEPDASSVMRELKIKEEG